MLFRSTIMSPAWSHTFEVVATGWGRAAGVTEEVLGEHVAEVTTCQVDEGGRGWRLLLLEEQLALFHLSL